MLTSKQKQALRQLPAIDQLLRHPLLLPFLKQYPHAFVSSIAAEQVALERHRILETPSPSLPQADRLARQVVLEIEVITADHLKPVINGTGIVIHTNLGRAVLSAEARAAIHRIARSFSNLEYNLATGKRGSRMDHVENLICQLTGAEAALVVNNNAAAVWLVLRTLAKDKEVIVSRGQLVEIGGSFRVSEIMKESGALLVEVGTTNKTHPRDIEHAITAETALLLKVHTSNFKLIGFTQEVAREEMVRIAKSHAIPCFEDLGSGVLYDLRRHGIGEEPTVQECIQAGVDLISFSGDKLLGGPQAGIIVGRKKWIERLKQNQLLRSLRVDKFTLAALEATLRHYLVPDEAIQKIPVLRQILKPLPEIRQQAEQLKKHLQQEIEEDLHLELVPSHSAIGGGSLPGVELPTICLALSPPLRFL